MAKYRAFLGAWNGACYETYDWTDLAATDEDAVIAEATKLGEMSFRNGDGDIEIIVQDEDEDEVWRGHFSRSVAKERQDELAAGQHWDCEHEFETYHLAREDGCWYAWTTNGGSRGAHDRMHGSGRWIERYEMPLAVTADEAKRWLIKHLGMDADEAAAAVRED
jgi:hypothetical protein